MKTFADFHIETHGRSGEIDTTCPQCSPTRKKKSARCLSVNVERGTWLCHHCGWAGGLGDGERRYEAPWRKPQHRKPEPIAPKPVDPIVDWFANRGISRAVLERNRVTPATVYMPQVEDHVGAVAFPYYRGAELVNVKYRDREKNFRMETGAERVLYGLNDIQPERCVIVEGEIDKLSAEVAGITSCVSVPDGAPSPTTKDYASKFAFLEADEALLNTVQEWILAVDADEPGRRLCDELARRLGREKCKRVKWPSDCKDANDVLVSFGSDVLRECIENAEPYPIEGVFTYTNNAAHVRHLFEHGWDKPVSTGWDELDRLYRVRPGELTVVTGIPGSGKSNWLDALVVNLAAMHGWRIGLFSPENQPLEDHMARMCEKYVGAPFYEGPTPRMTREQLDQAMAWADDKLYWYLPPEADDWTVENIIAAARSLVRQKGIQGFVIDPWNELEGSRPRDMTETEYVSHVLKRIRQFARQNAVHVWIVAHPQKLQREKDGNYPVPTMYDIAGSAHWRNKADNGLCVWRDFQNEHAAVKVIVQKVRFRQNGKIGEAQFRYKPATASYSEFGVAR
jgi:twinkle protein